MNVLITGVSGFIGQRLAEQFQKHHTVIGLDIDEGGKLYCDHFHKADITDSNALAKIFAENSLDAVIHTAAEKSLQRCEEEPERAHKINFEASLELYRRAKENGCHYIFLSSDIVFDGTTGNYEENDKTNPINEYGRKKAEVEERIKHDPRASICRTAMVIGPIPPNQHDTLQQALQNDELTVQGYIVQHVVGRLTAGKTVRLAINERCNPTTVDLLARQLLTVVDNTITGTLHLCGGESTSKYEFGCRIAEHLGLPTTLIEPVTSKDDLRPKDVSLSCKRTQRLLGFTFDRLDAVLESLPW